jgi:hypothetical protein
MSRVEAIATQQIPRLMEAWLGAAVEVEVGPPTRDDGFDLSIRHGDTILVVEVKRADEIALVESARLHLAGYTEGRADAVAVLAVPYMGPKAREFARSVGLSWLDLSGNADIRAPGVRILVEGKPNRFASPGRPSTAFSDKAARIARVMLVEPERWWRQAELIEATALSSGYVSKVVGRMSADDLLDGHPEDRSFRPRSPDLLLDAWAQVYDFRKHDIARYHAIGRTGTEVTEAVAGKLRSRADLQWAATGLAAAWRQTRYADFRLATFFVSAPLLDPEALGLRPVDRGENVWIAVPRDEGVLYAAEDVTGLRCAHPVQVYLDLLGHPERSEEAASYLRTHRLDWGRP